jgi:phosphoglucosamine mutase
MAKYFGTDGIRGTVGIYPITPDFALNLGYAVGVVLGNLHKKPIVIIGKDTRLSGYMFESSLEAGFVYAGVDVYMAGPLPTPAIAYLTTELHLSAGVVISASHNPYNDNGIKFFSANGTKLSDDIELAIEQQLQRPMVKAKYLGKVMRINDASEQYINFCLSTTNKLQIDKLKIVLDCANGATYKTAPQIFKRLGANIILLNNEPNGENINHQCGSTFPQILATQVIDHQADLGIAFDGDGDRVVFVDKHGKYYNGDKLIYIIMLYLKHLHQDFGGVVGTIMTNMGLEVALNKLGVDFVRTNVGDRYVLEELIKRKWLLGAESSGHILCYHHHSTGDGIIAALQILLALQTLSISLDKAIDWEEYPQILHNVKLTDKNKNWELLSKGIIEQANNELATDGRVIIRQSGTEAVVRIMVEAKTLKKAQLWADAIANTIQ